MMDEENLAIIPVEEIVTELVMQQNVRKTWNSILFFNLELDFNEQMKVYQDSLLDRKIKEAFVGSS